MFVKKAWAASDCSAGKGPGSVGASGRALAARAVAGLQGALPSGLLNEGLG